jgi:DNA polymerase III gamma/tau subunit
LENYLAAEKGLGPKIAQRLAHLAGGRVGTAIAYSQNPDLLEQYQSALQDLAHLLRSRLRQRLQYVEKRQGRKANTREQFAFLIATWLTFWRDVMIRRETDSIPLVNLDQSELIQETASLMSATQIERILKMHERSLGLLDSNVNPRLVIENLLLQLPVVG